MMAADSPKDARKQLSVIVPTYEEAANVAPLCERLFAATRKAGLVVELLLVDDDSGAGTVATRAAVERMAELGYAIKLHVRQRHEGKGLSSAVLLGLRLAQYDTLLVMDADLQHEPESVPAVAAPVLDRTADFAVGSRNVAGAAVAEGWPLVRRVISSGATLLARPLTTCSDPMSGFFCLSREALARAEKAVPNPMGYKIGLELMVRAQCKAVVEVPITFRDREFGESKLTMKQNLLYVLHLAHLYVHAYPTAVVAAVVSVLAALMLALDFALNAKAFAAGSGG